MVNLVSPHSNRICAPLGQRWDLFWHNKFKTTFSLCKTPFCLKPWPPPHFRSHSIFCISFLPCVLWCTQPTASVYQLCPSAPSFAEDSWSSDYFFFWTHWAETRCFHFFRQRSRRNLSDLLVYLASSYWTTVPRVWSCFTLQHRKAQAAPEDLSMCRSSILCRARMCLCLCIDTKINFVFKDSGKGSRLLLGLSRQVLSCKVFLCVSFLFLNGMLNILWFCVFFSCEAALGFIYLFLIDLFILCVRSFCLHVCMCTPCLVSSKVREGIRFLGTKVRGDYGLLCGFWESNRGHLDKHPVS